MKRIIFGKFRGYSYKDKLDKKDMANVLKSLLIHGTLVVFCYSIYKMFITPEQSTKSDYWLALGCIVVATVVTLLGQNKKA